MDTASQLPPLPAVPTLAPPPLAAPPPAPTASVETLGALKGAPTDRNVCFVVISTSALDETWSHPGTTQGPWAVDITGPPERIEYLAKMDMSDRNLNRFSRLPDGTWRITVPDNALARQRKAAIEHRTNQDSDADQVQVRVHPLRCSADVALDATRRDGAGCTDVQPHLASLRLQPGEDLQIEAVRNRAGRVVELRLKVRAT